MGKPARITSYNVCYTKLLRFAYYDFENNLELALDQMLDKELDAVLLHERGEYLAGLELGETWNTLLTELGHSAAELMARAIRDHWADCRVTLPVLLQREDAASVITSYSIHYTKLYDTVRLFYRRKSLLRRAQP